MAGDILDDYVQSTGVYDKTGLRQAILGVVDRFKHSQTEEQRQRAHWAKLSSDYLDDWTITELRTSGRFPPTNNERHYDGLVETPRDIHLKYATHPHVRIVLEGPRGTQFRLAIMLEYKYQIMMHKVLFSNFKVVFAADAVPSSLGVDVQETLVASIFKMLKNEHALLVRKMEHHCPNLERAVIRQLHVGPC